MKRYLKGMSNLIYEKEAKERRKLTIEKLKQLRPLITWYKNKEVAESHGVKQSLFNEEQNADKRKSKELTYHQFKAIMENLHEGERKIIEMKYLDVQSKSDLFIMEELHIKKDIYYSTKNDALDAMAVNFDLD